MTRSIFALLADLWMTFASWRALRWAKRWMRAQSRAEHAHRRYRRWMALSEGRPATETEGG